MKKCACVGDYCENITKVCNETNTALSLPKQVAAFLGALGKTTHTHPHNT